MREQPEQNTLPHARFHPTFKGNDAWITLKRSFGLQVTCVIDVLGWYYWHVIHGRLFNQALAYVRSAGAGINCLYCMILHFQTTPNTEWYLSRQVIQVHTAFAEYGIMLKFKALVYIFNKARVCFKIFHLSCKILHSTSFAPAQA